MAFEGELPDLDSLKMSPGELDLPAPMMSLDLPAPSQDNLVLPNMPTQDSTAKKTVQAKKPAAGKTQTKPAPQKTAVNKVAKQAMPAANKIPLLLGLASIVLLVILTVVMVLFEVPVNAIPDLTLTTYVQGLWLVAGCLFIIAMLQDVKTALLLTGLDIVLLATVFPTLWLILNMPMNPMYFYVIAMIMLIAFVYMPLNLLRPKTITAKA